MDLQIGDFYRDAAAALLSLYQAFPRKVALYVDDLIGPEEPDEFGLPSKRHQSCLAAMIWLAEEGYLRYESTLQFLAIDQAVLTEKGFLRLSGAAADANVDPTLPPSIRRARSSVANRLREALASGDGEALAIAADALFRAGASRS